MSKQQIKIVQPSRGSSRNLPIKSVPSIEACKKFGIMLMRLANLRLQVRVLRCWKSEDREASYQVTTVGSGGSASLGNFVHESVSRPSHQIELVMMAMSNSKKCAKQINCLLNQLSHQNTK